MRLAEVVTKSLKCKIENRERKTLGQSPLSDYQGSDKEKGS